MTQAGQNQWGTQARQDERENGKRYREIETGRVQGKTNKKPNGEEAERNGHDKNLV